MTAKRTGFRRVLRWIRNLVLGLIALLVIAVLTQSLWLPKLVGKLAADQGLDVRYDDLDLWPLGGALSLTGVQVRELPPEGSDPASADAQPLLLRLDYLHADADISALLTGDLRVHRVEIDGVDAWLARDADGAWNFDPLLARWAADSEASTTDDEPEEAPPEAEPEEPKPWDLRSPVRVDAVRAQGLRLHFADALAEPALDTRLDLHLAISDIGVADTPARLMLSADAPEVLDGLRIDGTVDTSESELAARLAVDLFGLHLPRIQHLLASAGIQPVADQHAFRLQLEADLSVPEPDPHSLTGELRVREVALTADLQPALTLAELRVPLERLAPDALSLGDTLLSGLAAGAERGADGVLRVAGLDLVGAPPRADEPDEPETEPEVDPEPSSQAIQLGQFLLENAQLTWRDAAVEPAVDLELGFAATLSDLAIGTASEPRLDLEVSLPGVWESLSLTGSGSSSEGATDSGDSSQRFAIQLAAEGLQPSAIEPYLRAAGIEHELQAGSLSAAIELTLNRSLEGEDELLEVLANVTDLSLSDGQPLAGWKQLQVHLTQSPSGTQVHELELDGTSLDVRRDADGAIHVAGLVIGAEQEQAAVQRAPADRAPAGSAAPGGDPSDGVAEAAGPAAADTDQDSTPARLRVDQLRWTGTRVHYLDETTPEPVDLTLDDLGLELSGLDLFGDPAREDPAPAQVRTWFQAAGLADEFGIEGTLAAAPGGLDLKADLALTGRGLVVDAVAPLLEQAGVLSELQGASLDLGIQAHARQDGEDFALDAALRELAFVDGGEELLALDALSLEGLRSGPRGTSVAALTVDGPRFIARRDAEGGLHAGGFHLPPAPAPEDGEPAADAAPEPAGSSSEAPAAADAASEEPAPFRVERIALTGLRLGWADDAVVPEVDTAVSGSLQLEGVDTASGAPPAQILAQLGLEGAFDGLRLEGSLQADPADLSLALDTELSGVGGRSIAAYLPPGLEFTSGTTLLRATAQASYTAIEGGARRAQLELRGVELAAGPEVEPDLLLGSLKFGAPLLDDAGRRYEIDGVELAGFELRLERTGEERFELAGLAFEAPPEEPVDVAAQAAPVEPDAPDQPNDPSPDTGGADDEEFALLEDGPDEDAESGAQEPDAADPLAAGLSTPGGPDQAAGAAALPQAAKPPPTVITGPLAIGPLRITYTDRTRPELAPVVASLGLFSDGEQTLVAPEPEDLPALNLRLEAALEPLVESAGFDVVISPWAADPSVVADLQVRGLRGERLADVAPELAESMSLDDLPNGSFDAHLETVLNVRRRGALDMGLDRDFGLSFLLRDLALLPAPDAEPVLSLTAVEVEADRIALAKGDMRFSRIEVTGPRVHAVQDAQGLHVAGITFPPASEAEVEEQAEELVQTELDLEEEDVKPADPDAGVIEVQSLTIAGLQTSYSDETTVPRTYLPIRDMELEVRGLSTLALTQPRPIRVEGFLEAGMVELPERTPAGSLLSGVLGAAGSLVAGGGDYESEERHLWDQLELSSRMTLAPSPKGWFRTNLLGLELPAFRGLASGAGVEIGDGLMDTQVTVRFYGEEGLGLQTKTQFDYLSLSEPADGPISRYLALPAPLDTVLFLLRNDSGQQTIPLSVRMSEDGISAGEIAGAAANVLAQLIGDAVAASPLRIGGTLTDLVGLSGSPTPTSTETSYVEYVAGSVTPDGGLQNALEPVLQRLRSDPNIQLVLQHELGPGDLAMADRLANPDSTALDELLERLRSRKAELLRRRITQAANVQALYQVGEIQAADDAASELRRMDRELLETDTGLAEILNRMRPGSERRADRRARNAGRAIAQERLDRLEAALLRSGIRRIYDRIDVRRPRPTDLRLAAEGEPALPAELGGRVSLTPRPRK